VKQIKDRAKSGKIYLNKAKQNKAERNKWTKLKDGSIYRSKTSECYSENRKYRNKLIGTK
jgi:hypothetical protein